MVVAADGRPAVVVVASALTSGWAAVTALTGEETAAVTSATVATPLARGLEGLGGCGGQTSIGTTAGSDATASVADRVARAGEAATGAGRRGEEAAVGGLEETATVAGSEGAGLEAGAASGCLEEGAAIADVPAAEGGRVEEEVVVEAPRGGSSAVMMEGAAG